MDTDDLDIPWTQVTLPGGEEYGYAVGRAASAVQHDVLAQFTASCAKAGLGWGFYYSLTNNFFLNVASHEVQNGTLPGQQNVSQAEFETIALGHVRELWTRYGNLTEIWFDGGPGAAAR